MPTVTIKATAPNCPVGKDQEGNELTEARASEFDFSFPDSALEAVEAYGDDVVLSLFVKSAKIQAQAAMRQMLVAGRTDSDVKAYMTTNWRPGAEGKDPFSTVLTALKSLSPEERAELLAKFS